MVKKRRLLISPTPNAKSGMYISNLAKSLSKYFEIVNYGNQREPAPKELFRYLFKADIFLLNWIENEPNKSNGTIRYLMVQAFLSIARLMNKKILWTFHNIEPHNKKGKAQAKKLMRRLANQSDLILHHTVESLCLTEEKRNFCFFHPFESRNQYNLPEDNLEFNYDILIWGAIAPYKSIAEFLEFVKTDSDLSGLKILIAGKVSSELYKEKLEKSLSNNITFINRFHSDEEIRILHEQSHYVLFSHQGVSVLNSGQLVVSLGHGANVIGPSKGAFKELADLGIIYTYNSFEEIVGIIRKKTPIDKHLCERFIREHSWDNFAENLNDRISSLY